MKTGNNLKSLCNCCSLSCIPLFATPWPTACQVSLSFTISWNWLKLISIELVMSSNHLTLLSPFSSCSKCFPALGSILMSQPFTSRGQSIRASVLASVLPVNIQGWFPLGLAGLIPLLFNGLSSLLYHHGSKASVLWCSVFFVVQLSHPYMTTGKIIALTIQAFVG